MGVTNACSGHLGGQAYTCAYAMMATATGNKGALLPGYVLINLRWRGTGKNEKH